MDNKAIANLLHETADLLEIDGRILSASALMQTLRKRSKTCPSASRNLISEPRRFSKSKASQGMLANLQEIFKDGPPDGPR